MLVEVLVISCGQAASRPRWQHRVASTHRPRTDSDDQPNQLMDDDGLGDISSCEPFALEIFAKLGDCPLHFDSGSLPSKTQSFSRKSTRQAVQGLGAPVGNMEAGQG